MFEAAVFFGIAVGVYFLWDEVVKLFAQPKELLPPLKAGVRDVVDSIDLPLPDEDRKAACSRIYRAVKQLRRRVPLRFGERLFIVKIEYFDTGTIGFTIEERTDHEVPDEPRARRGDPVRLPVGRPVLPEGQGKGAPPPDPPPD